MSYLRSYNHVGRVTVLLDGENTYVERGLGSRCGRISRGLGLCVVDDVRVPLAPAIIDATWSKRFSLPDSFALKRLQPGPHTLTFTLLDQKEPSSGKFFFKVFGLTSC